MRLSGVGILIAAAAAGGGFSASVSPRPPSLPLLLSVFWDRHTPHQEKGLSGFPSPKRLFL